MVQAQEFLSQLIRSALGRTEPPAEPSRLAEARVAAFPEPRGPAGVETARTLEQPEAPPPGLDPGIVGVIAEKVLRAWLQNRYQLLFPFALNLRRLDREQAVLVIHAMIAAAHADGSFDGNEQRRIEGTFDLIDASRDETAFLEDAISRPKPLNAILAGVRDVQTGALVYAASLMAVDQRKPVNRHYLRYLSTRLQLSDELVESLEQRYRSAG